MNPTALFAQGVHVAVMPHVMNVPPGAGFDLELDVTSPGSPFNGFDAVLSFDPGALTLVPSWPATTQAGSYMTGACANFPFHVFGAAGDSIAITEVLLCDGISLLGPGQLYKLHFTASTTPQVTHVTIRSVTFYNSGLYVNPVFAQPDTIGIGVALGVPGGSLPGDGARLAARPNPFVAGTSIRVDTPSGADGSLIVCDIGGRVVRHLAGGRFGPGSREVTWDGRGDRGQPLAAGVYLVRLVGGPRALQMRVALLR
jgi:hypothetical protein